MRSPIGLAASPATRTTIPIATEQLAAIDALVGEGAFPSRAACIDLAVRRLLWDLEEEAMHAEFEAASKDPEWVAESVSLAEEAVVAGWEVLLADERDDVA
jgi:Arc/MetJ-type ribon-helix-helix transcriptional regulator